MAKEHGKLLFVFESRVSMREPTGGLKFIPTRRDIVHCLVLGNRKRIVAYGNAIRFPQDRKNSELAMKIATGRAMKALKRRRTAFHYYFPLPSYAYADQGNAVSLSLLGKTVANAIKKAKKKDLSASV